MKTKLDIVPLYHQVTGEGEPILMISGLSADHMAWLPLIDPLSRQYKVITFENRGCGQSPSPNGTSTIEHFAHDTIALMDQLNIDKAHIVGQSMGTTIAQYIAADFPNRVDKLILSNGMTKSDKTSEYAFRLIGHLMDDGAPRKRIMEALLPWSFSNNFLDNKDNVDLIIDFYLHNPNPQTIEGFWLQYKAVYSVDTTPLLPKIKAPTLIIAGDEDLLTNLKDAEVLQRGIKGSQLTVIPNMAHVPHVEDPEHFLKIVQDFLRPVTNPNCHKE